MIRSVARALPPNYVEQEKLISAFREEWAKKHFNLDRLEELHRAVGVGGRHLAVPLERYADLKTFEQRNTAWTEVAVSLGEHAIRSATREAGLEIADLEHIFFVTITGLATPSIDARLCNRLGFKSNIRRTPIFGLGCVAGAAGTARMSDWLMGFPKSHAVLLSVELCSRTLQREDLSIANIIASGLFGDGAAAMVMSGDQIQSRGPQVIASTSVFYPNTERVMGWDFLETGFKVVLSAKVPEVVAQNVRTNVDEFLKANGKTRNDIQHWVAHTGGPKVLRSFEQALELPAEALALSWKSLKEVGNLSSASVLFVLSELLESGKAKPGDLGLLMAMGPGFCAELILLQW